MLRQRLTNSAVERFQCREGRDQDILWCGEIRGFGMRLSTKSNSRTYFLQYRVKGTNKQRQITIGRHNDPWRVEDARARALDIKVRMLSGVDPVEEQQKKEEETHRQAAIHAAHTMTLRAVMKHYLEHKRTKHGPLRPATKKDIQRCCEDNLGDFIDKPVANLTRDKCLETFVTLSERSQSQANLTMFYLRALCNYARELHATEAGEYTILVANPVTRMFKLQKPNPRNARKGRIPLNRVGAVWAMLQERRANAYTVDERTAVDWIRCMLLTGLRLTELSSLKWTDVDLEAKEVRLRAEVVKNHNGMILPMSTVLHEILSERSAPPPLDEKVLRRRHTQRSSEYVFASAGKKTPYMKDPRAALKAVSRVAGRHISPHDVRRTVDDIALACKIDPDERRQLLNHVASDVHGEHYANNPDPESLRPAVQSIADFIVRASLVARSH